MATRANGKVSQIYVADKIALFRLSGLPTASAPRNNNFELRKSDQNYNALYSLALSAAINRYDLSVETTKAMDAKENAVVKTMWVNW